MYTGILLYGLHTMDGFTNHMLKLGKFQVVLSFQHSLAGCRVNVVEEEDLLGDCLVHHFISLGNVKKRSVLVNKTF